MRARSKVVRNIRAPYYMTLQNQKVQLRYCVMFHSKRDIAIPKAEAPTSPIFSHQSFLHISLGSARVCVCVCVCVGVPAVPLRPVPPCRSLPVRQPPSPRVSGRRTDDFLREIIRTDRHDRNPLPFVFITSLLMRLEQISRDRGPRCVARAERKQRAPMSRCCGSAFRVRRGSL